MAVFKRILLLAALAALTVAQTGCTRKITRVEVVQQPQTCFTCHSDQNTMLVAATQQWEHSLHASGGTLNENDSSCKGCHTSEGFVARATGTTAPDVIDNPTSIHCFTCHAPHTNGDFGLRWTTPATLMNGTTYSLNSGNICVACHQARRDVRAYVTGRVTLSNRWGPHHSVQGDMLLGSNGYEYAGYTYSRTPHNIATTSDGKDGCLECHFKTTLQNVVGGHSFNMAYDLNGEEVLNVAACAPCHGEIADFNDVGNVQADVTALVGDLQTRLVNAGLVDGTTGLPKSVTTNADSAGAVWNYLMVKEDRSEGVHNADYEKGLLLSAIQYIQGAATPRMLSARLAKR